MIEKKLVDKILYKIDMDDVGECVVSVDDNGDWVTVKNPELNFEEVKKGILNHPVIHKRVEDSGSDYLKLRESCYQGKSLVEYRVIIRREAVGTIIKAETVRIRNFSDSGEKEFVSFESLGKYLSRGAAR